MSTMYNLLHIPLCTVMLILIFNSTAYCHAHSFTFYILFFISYFSFILSYVYFPCVVFSIFALSMERTRLSFHCWLYSLCIVVYVTNKTWNLKLDRLSRETRWGCPGSECTNSTVILETHVPLSQPHPDGSKTWCCFHPSSCFLSGLHLLREGMLHPLKHCSSKKTPSSFKGFPNELPCRTSACSTVSLFSWSCCGWTLPALSHSPFLQVCLMRCR